MSRTPVATPGARELAQLLIEHVVATHVVSLDALARNPFDELARDGSVTIEPIDPATLPATCSIAATYSSRTVPATIAVSNDSSSGRRAFSCLHEYAHHLRDQVEAVLLALFDAPEAGQALEEQMCDAFAAAVLIPDRVREHAMAGGVSAARVAQLITATRASREACAVAAAQALTSPGYVMLLDESGTALFTARSQDALPVARGTSQGANELRTAARVGRSRGITSVSFASGNSSPDLFFDAAPVRGATVAVLVTDSPAWAQFTAATLTGSSPQEGHCEACGRDFTTFEPACRQCWEPRCPVCGECGCIPGLQRAPGERRCARCGDLCGPARFASASATVCRDCS